MYQTNLVGQIRDNVCDVLYDFFSGLEANTPLTADIELSLDNLTTMKDDLWGKLDLSEQGGKRKIDEPYEPGPFRYIVAGVESATILMLSEDKGEALPLYETLEERGTARGYPIYTYALLSPGCLMVIEDNEDGGFSIKKYNIKFEAL